MKNLKWPLLACSVLAPLALIGCGGGGNGSVVKPDSPTPTPLPVLTPGPTSTPDPNATPGSTPTMAPTATPGQTNANIAAANFLALQSSGTSLVAFRGDAPQNATTRVVTGLPGGVRLRGIDARVAPRPANSTTGDNGSRALYGFGSNNQLYTLNITGPTTISATPVGAPAQFTNFTLGNGAYGIDFNPAADRLRVVSGTQNERINPNNGAAVDGDSTLTGTQPDGTLRYDTSDRSSGRTPIITAAAYTNNNVGTSSTLNYAVDTAAGALVTQGRAASGSQAAVSPNSGVLYTVGLLGSDFPNDVGLEIFGAQNNAVLVGGRGFYSVNLTTGAAIKIGDINSSDNLTDITVAF